MERVEFKNIQIPVMIFALIFTLAGLFFTLSGDKLTNGGMVYFPLIFTAIGLLIGISHFRTKIVLDRGILQDYGLRLKNEVDLSNVSELIVRIEVSYKSQKNSNTKRRVETDMVYLIGDPEDREDVIFSFELDRVSKKDRRNFIKLIKRANRKIDVSDFNRFL